MASGRPVLLHRDNELGVVDEVLAGLAEGRPAVLVIQGTRGIGKTRLLHAALARRPGGVVLSARGHADERSFAFGIVRQLFDPMMSGSKRADPGAPAAVLDANVRAPALAAVPYDGSAPVVPATLLDDLYRATRSLTAGQPLIIAVDDLNHADPQSAQWCSYIARRLDGLPIAMILTCDVEDRSAGDAIWDILALPYARSLRPSALCRRCAATLMESALGAPVDDEIVTACHRLTKGNPLLLLETAGRLAAADVLPDRSELPHVMRIGATALSETVLEWLSGRYPSLLALLQSLAVIAPYAGLETAAMLAGYGAVAAEEAGHALAGAGLLEGSPPQRFTHDLVQSTILARMDPRARDELHRRAASLLHRLGSPPKRSARHLLSASPTGDPWAVSVLREAAREAVSENAWEDATRYLHRALATAKDQAVLQVTAELGAVEVHLDIPACLRHFRTVTALAGDTGERADSLAPFATALLTLNSPEAASAFCDIARGFDDDPTGRLPDREVLLRLSAQALLTGQSYGSRAAMRQLNAEPGAVTSAGARDYLATAALSGAARGRHLHRTLALARRCLDGGGPIPPTLVMALLWAGRVDEAAYWSEQAAAEARAHASMTGQALAVTLLSEVAYRKGKLRASLAHAREAIHFARASHAPGLHVAAVSCAARVLLERDELDVAHALFDEVAREPVHPLLQGTLLEARGRVSIARGDVREGLRALLEAGRQMLSAGVVNPACAGWRGQAALAYLRLGQHGTAHRLAEEELELARAWGAPDSLGRALSIASTTAEGSRRLDLLTEALTVLDGPGGAMERIRAMLRLGIALQAAGESRRAHDTLNEAYVLADGCGAVRLAALAERNLATIGGRARGGQADGPSPLTAGEMRVTELVLRGMSNLQVATELSISKRTVDTHLARIYRKLGIHTRAELAEIIKRLGDHQAGIGPLPGQEEWHGQEE
ncbi:helix-turn-helix transcriptional regulator [Microbispora catharanthi]|uniref:AAA family ATPase n=1 Tax=Microbispora catharanthi TaxID=1712871 RepID=A0A5N6BJ90_9ACTN|nr:AAA family ATPase [Microbispora catharanthi]KAB8181121.1 AAA family ATPase [Microbispora catharanthi]